MGLDIEYIDGQTPLDEDEKDGLRIKSITLRGELDEFEQYNIEKAMEWLMRKKFSKEQILTEGFVRELHFRMLGDVWSWAGEFRRTNKNIGVDSKQVSIQLKQLLEDCLFWIVNKSFDEEELVICFKHRLVNIHCFSNGNGMHSRLMADLMMKNIYKKPEFTWGQGNLVEKSDSRKNYIAAIRLADKGEIEPLIKFAKS